MNTFTATLPNGQIVTCNSTRAYTHAVVFVCTEASALRAEALAANPQSVPAAKRPYLADNARTARANIGKCGVFCYSTSEAGARAKLGSVRSGMLADAYVVPVTAA